MMRVVFGLATLLGFVSAAELPQFSATDDYDELNLNIRLLSTNATNASNETSTEVYTVETTVGMTVSGNTLTDAASVAADKGVTGGAVTAFAAATETPASATVVSAVTAARRLSASNKRRLADVACKMTFRTTFSDAAAATKLQQDVAAGGAFDAAFAEAFTTALSALGAGYAVSGVASEGAVVKDASGATVPAPAPAAPAASPAAPAAKKDASSANTVFVSFATIALAAVASVF